MLAMLFRAMFGELFWLSLSWQTGEHWGQSSDFVGCWNVGRHPSGFELATEYYTALHCDTHKKRQSIFVRTCYSNFCLWWFTRGGRFQLVFPQRQTDSPHPRHNNWITSRGSEWGGSSNWKYKDDIGNIWIWIIVRELLNRCYHWDGWWLHFGGQQSRQALVCSISSGSITLPDVC